MRKGEDAARHHINADRNDEQRKHEAQSVASAREPPPQRDARKSTDYPAADEQRRQPHIDETGEGVVDARRRTERGDRDQRRADGRDHRHRGGGHQRLSLIHI